MRLPVLPGEDHPIDRAEGKRMVDRAIDGGITYFDTAYGYHNEESEVFVGEALKGLRNRVTLTTKLPCWKVEKREDMDALLDTQLQRLQTDHVDFYLLHALNAKSFDKMVSLGVFEFLDRAQAQGKIRYPGFSFHDDSETFHRIVDAYDWKLAQVQMNILDEHKQATMDGVRYAAKKGIGIVVMEPLRGGALAKTLPPEVRDIYAMRQNSAAAWSGPSAICWIRANSLRFFPGCQTCSNWKTICAFLAKQVWTAFPTHRGRCWLACAKLMRTASA